MEINHFLPNNERERQEELESYGILNTEEEESFNSLTRLASYICQTPISLISLIDNKRQWFKAKHGLRIKETTRDISFCQHAVLDAKPFEVQDTEKDNRFNNNPLVLGDHKIRFYRGSPLISADGYCLGTLCVIDRIPRVLTTEQKEALDILASEVMVRLELRRSIKLEEIKRDVLQRTELNCHNIMENSQGLICSHTMEGIILSANPAAAKSLQYERKDLIGKSLYDIVDPKTQSLFQNYLHEFKEKPLVTGVMRVVTSNGETRYWSYRNIRMDEEGKSSYVVGFSQDITEHILLEKALRNAKEKAEEATRVKDQFLANMSHEIRTPINAIMGFSNLLLEQPNHKKQKEFIKAINISSSNLLAIINDILDMSKIEEGKMTFEEIPLEIVQILDTIKIIVQEKVREKNIKFTIKIDKAIPSNLYGDKVKLSQIILNLVGNALKFTEKGGVSIEALLVSKRSTSADIVFKIKDTGIGITKENQKIIFERFRQENNDTTRLYGGAGLGLSITKKLIELQGGNITLESEPTKGSIFSFQLSFKRKTEKKNKKPSPVKQQYKERLASTLLLVEDNVLNQLLASTVLKERGFNVEIASNGKEAIQWLEKKPFDLILMDVQMPVMDGYQTTIHIRKKLKAPLNKIPIIALTAHASGAEKNSCLNIGMDDYSSKPFDPDELCNKIIKYIKSKKQKKATIKPTEKIRYKHINLSYLTKASLGKEEFIEKMIVLFLKEVPLMLKSTRLQLKKENWIEIQYSMHKLKTNLATVGAKRLSSMSLLVEEKAKTPRARKEIPHLIESLEGGFQDVKEELKSVLLSFKK